MSKTKKDGEKAETLPAMLANFDKLPDAAYVRLPVVAGIFSIGPATVWRWVKIGRLPQATRLGPNVRGWNVGALRKATQVEA